MESKLEHPNTIQTRWKTCLTDVVSWHSDTKDTVINNNVKNEDICSNKKSNFLMCKKTVCISVDNYLGLFLLPALDEGDIALLKTYVSTV